MNGCKSRAALGFIAAVTLLLGGCVTWTSATLGERFFPEGGWEKSKKFFESALEKGIGTETMADVRTFLPPPLIEEPRTTPGGAKLDMRGWYYCPSDGRSIDTPISESISSHKVCYRLVLAFTRKEGVLISYEHARYVVPFESFSWTTVHVVGEGVALMNMSILTHMMEDAMNRVADRAAGKMEGALDGAIEKGKTGFDELLNKGLNGLQK